MADPLSTGASVIALISFAQSIVPLINDFVNGAREFRKEFSHLAQQIREFVGILYAIQDQIRRFEKMELSRPLNQGIG
jgi:hypothetical protein